MTFTAIVSGIFAIAKAVTIIAEYLDKTYELWIDYKLNKIEASKVKHSDKRTALMSAITKASTNEERKALSVILSELTRPN